MSDTDRHLDYTITYLEMTTAPGQPPPPPSGAALALIRAKSPPRRWFLHLYQSVGAAHEWTDWLRAPPGDLDAFLQDPDTALYSLIVDGWSGGFFMLDWRRKGVCDLAYFGLAPEAQGRGLSRWLLGEALRAGWERNGVKAMTVQTNTLDHPRALSLYQRAGFTPYAQETRKRPARRASEVSETDMPKA